MADDYTVCAQANAANVIAILTSAAIGHHYVATMGPFDNLNAYPISASVGRLPHPAGDGKKVIIHTISPP